MRALPLPILISAVYVAAIPVYGELIFQPPKSESDKEWREAGSVLLAGVARIFDGLAALEAKDDNAEFHHFENAKTDLQNAETLYRDLAKDAQGQKMSTDRLSSAEGKNIQAAFARYRLELPADEKAAAHLAADEAKGLGIALDKFRDMVKESNIQAVRQLLSAIARNGDIGTNTALLMKITAQN